MELHIHPPAAGDYAEYYQRYISLVPAGDILEMLRDQARSTLEWLGRLTPEQSAFRYAEGKWSVRELLGHIVDTERIMAYRALRISRNDQQPLPGFEQDDFVLYSPHDRMPLYEILEEYTHVRSATLCLFRSMDEAAWDRAGIASNNHVTVRALAWIIAGHELAHLQILRERYQLG
jgi:hypothetical protein